MKKILENLLPLLIGFVVAFLLYSGSGWWGFWLIFLWIGGWISVGIFISGAKKGKEKDLGRKISILMVGLLLLVFIGFIEHENLQLEEAVFYIAAGIYSRVIIHYAIAKVFGPLIWGRGFCGWACWTAAILDWLPIKENRTIPKKYTYLRFPFLFISILIPYLFITSGYDYMNKHIDESLGMGDQFIWFLVGNGIYFLLGIPLAFIFQKRRAFCKVLCPVSLVMKIPTKVSMLKMKPTGKECIDCELCNKNCPMDVDVMGYIKAQRKVSSTECVLCSTCKYVCPVGAIE